MGTIRTAVAFSSLALGLSSACGTSTTSCGPNGCVTYTSAYPTTVYPYTADTYYYPPADTFYANLPADAGAFDAGALLADGGGLPASALPELIADARAGNGAINAGVEGVVATVKALVQTTPQQNGNTVTFGPMVRGNAEYSFTIRNLSDTKHFGWKLEARPESSSADYALVAGGTIRTSDAPQLGKGEIGIDGDALASADSSLHTAGQLRLGFDSDSKRKVLRFAFSGYTPDSTSIAPFDGTAAAYTLDKSETASRVVVRTNVEGTDTDAEELVAIKVHSKKGVGTRADAIATGGDIPAGQALFASTCIGPDLDPATASTSKRLCSLDGSDCTVLSGPETITCPSGLEPDLPDPDAGADDEPTGMPAEPPVPAKVSDGTQG
jgi:hypothetical protein